MKNDCDTVPWFASENVQLLMLAKELVETVENSNRFICLAVAQAHREVTKKTMQETHPILLAIKRGLPEAYTLDSWLLNNVPDCPDLNRNTMALCRMAWIDKLMEEFSA